MRISLRSKWALALALTALIPLTALSYRAQAIQRASLAETERNLEGAIVRQASAALSDELARVESASVRVATLLADSRVTDPELRLQLARDVVTAEARIARLAAYTRDGALIFSAGVPAAKPASEQLEPSVLADKRPWAFDRSEKSAIFRFKTEVKRADSITGYVLSWVDPSYLESKLETLSMERFENPRRLAIADTQLQPVAGGLPLATVAAAVQASGLHAELTDKPVEITKSFLDGNIATVGTVLPMPELAAVVVTARPEEEAFASLGRARREFAWTLAAATVVAAALALLLAAGTTRPIAELVRLSGKYARRDFGARAHIRTGDELEGLGHSLEAMADGLAASEQEIQRRAKIEAGLSRYMPEEVANAVASGEMELGLGGTRRDISVLFADVVGFTSFAEAATPEQVSALLNELFGLLSETVFRHGGVVDKFMGDCVMALFGATGHGDQHPAAALACAEDMHRFVEANREAWLQSHGFEVRLGIGCATGIAVVGNLGSERRMEFTAIGDPVNVAARLEGLARPGQTLCTSETAKRAPDFPTRSRGMHPLRGKQAQVEVYEMDEEA